MKHILSIKICLITACLLMICLTAGHSSSHREAPLISNDPLADNTDLYAFRSPDNPDMITLIATYIPMQLPHGAPNYYTFGENIRYEIHIDNDADVVGDEVTYRFTFNIVNEDPTTFFNIRLGAQNQKATYTLERSMDGGMSFQTIITDGVVPPNNIGDRSITGGAGLGSTYDALFQSGISTASTGERVFAGPTDDPFFVDLAGIFDLGDAPRQDGNNADGLACYNVSALAIQVPISTLLKAGAPSTPTNILDSDYVIGVWASASRPAITTLSATDGPTYSGDWIQVSRIGMPLTNEAVIPVGDKDYWNSITPYDEIAETTLDEHFYNPELALYMDDSQFGGAVPSFGPLRIQSNSLGAFDFRNGQDGLFSLKGSPAVAGTALDDAVFGTLLLPDAGKPRSVDLWPTFHTGVPNVRPYQLATGKNGDPLAAGKPFVNNFLPNGGDMLRLNMAVPVTPRDDANFSSLGLIQAAAIGLTVAPFNETLDLEFIPNMDGFPNGRRLEDDVTRIELQAVAGVVLAAVGLWYDDYDPATSPSPVTEDLLNVLTYTTGVETNDVEFTGGFPYVGQPHSGTGYCSGELIFNNETPLTDPVAKVFVSSNTTGVVSLYSYADGQAANSTFDAVGTDSDGIAYDSDNDLVYQINRSDNVINTYENVISNLTAGISPIIGAASTSDFSGARELAVSGNSLVVAQDAATSNGDINQFLVYTAGPNGITLSKTHVVDINLWGMTFGGDDLIAIVDNSADVAIYNDFLMNVDGPLAASSIVTIEDMVRTHGIAYDLDNDVMYLTDVGDGGVADDGAFIVVADWTAASNDGTISSGEQIRIAGPATFLGNPVDIDYDNDLDMIYIAERANSGGRFLGFQMPIAGGDIAPTINEFLAGASAVNSTNCSQAPAVPQSIVYYSFDGCDALIEGGENFDYSEFAPEYPNVLDCAAVTSSTIYRENPMDNRHSCTEGLNNSESMCVSSEEGCDYLPGDDKSVKFDMSIVVEEGTEVTISGITFSQTAPETYSWIDGDSGENNYPTLYGVRVLVNGTEVYQVAGLPTSTDWTLETITIDDLILSSEAMVTVELLGYCVVGNGADVTAWDLEDLNVIGSCANSTARLAGRVASQSGVSLEELTVNLISEQPEYPRITATSENGDYAFEDLSTEYSYIVQPVLEDTYHNGVSTLDILFIQRHILSVQNFDMSTQYLAADVNASGNVTAADISEIRKLILEKIDGFSAVPVWSFVNSDFQVDDLSDYTELTERDLVGGENNLDFIAVKRGDINLNAVIGNVNSNVDTRTGDAISLEINDLYMSAGQTVIVPVIANEFKNVHGMQFTLKGDGVIFNSMNATDVIKLNPSHYNISSNDGMSFSWSDIDSKSVAEGDVVMTMSITATRSGQLSSMLTMNEEITDVEAYVGDDIETVKIELNFTGDSVQTYADELVTNSPNPFSESTNVEFTLSKAQNVTINVYETTGRAVYSITGYYQAGTNSITIDESTIQGVSSVLICELQGANFKKSMLMTRF